MSIVRLDPFTSPQVGNILVDDRGMTLYRFTSDQPNASTCYDDCAAAWPRVPLYCFVADRQPGDVNGQGQDGEWFVVSPATSQ